MIQLDIKEQDLNNVDYVKRLINKIIITRMIEGESNKLTKCFDFYNGKAPVTYFKDSGDYKCQVINLTKPIVDIATETFIGEMPDITIKGNKKEKDKVSVLSQKLYDAGFDDHFYECCKYASKTGSGYFALFNELGDTFPRFREINPLYAECVYDCTLARKHVMSYYIVESNDGSANNIGLSRYIIYVYTKERIYAFESPMTYTAQSTKPYATKKMIIKPYFAWKKGEQELSYVNHDFGDIPLVEIPNNAEYIGDAECVFELISLYNGVQNNRCKNLYDVVNYVLMIKNVRLGDEEETKKVISMLKENRILPAEGDNVDAKFLSNPLNQEELQVLANNIKDLIHLISRVPDLSSVDFSQNASDPILKIKTKPLLDLCKDKEKKCTMQYKRIIKMVLHWCSLYSKDYDTFDFDLSKTRLKYAHVLPSNDTDMANAIAILQNSKMANPEVLLQNLSFIPNVHEYIKGMEKWNEDIDKRKELNNNKNNGINQTNIDRHNETNPTGKDKMDNVSNFAKGGAGVLNGIND